MSAVPVKEPFSCPKSSLSNNVSCRVAQLIVTIIRSRRRLLQCRARATSSFPVPLFPRTKTVASVGATFSTIWKTFRIAGPEPIIS